MEDRGGGVRSGIRIMGRRMTQGRRSDVVGCRVFVMEEGLLTYRGGRLMGVARRVGWIVRLLVMRVLVRIRVRGSLVGLLMVSVLPMVGMSCCVPEVRAGFLRMRRVGTGGSPRELRSGLRSLLREGGIIGIGNAFHAEDIDRYV